MFPVSSLKDEENGITKSATGNNKSKYISSKWEEKPGYEGHIISNRFVRNQIQEAPFFRDYWEFQVCEVRKYFSELVDFAKAYAKETRGIDLPVSGNFYNPRPVLTMCGSWV